MPKAFYEYTGSQDKRRGAQRGEPTGEVRCPRKNGAPIAEMRCGEYQLRDGCQLGCPNSVKPARLTELQDALRVSDEPEREESVFDTCASCGRSKSETRSPLGRCCSQLADWPHYYSRKEEVPR